MPNRLITLGPYHGRVLNLNDDIAKQAEKEGWAVDTTAKDFDPYNAPTGVGSPPYPASLTSFLESLEGVEPADAKPAPEPEPKAKPAPVEAAKSAPAPSKAAAEEPKGKSK